MKVPNPPGETSGMSFRGRALRRSRPDPQGIVPPDGHPGDPNRLEFPSPIGAIVIGEKNGAVTELSFLDRPSASTESRPTPVLRACRRQIEEYFAGIRTVFDLPLDLDGTIFQNEVWAALRKVAFGRSCSYGDLARMVGRPAAVRAVGAANGANPVSIIIPCHRVIGSDGRLTGYGGGLWRKEWLLAHERRFASALGPLFPLSVSTKR